METKLKAYSKFRKEQANNFLRQEEIPVGHYVSLPLPAIQDEKAAYSFFACPVQKDFENGNYVGSTYGAIDRIWTLSAQSGSLLKYEKLTSVINDPIAVGKVAGTLQDIRTTLTEADTLLDELAPAYFSGADADKAKKVSLLAILGRLLPDQLYQLYQLTNPSFLNWLINP